MSSVEDAVLIGPILHFRGIEDDEVRLAAVAVFPADAEPVELEVAGTHVGSEVLATSRGRVARVWEFRLPLRADAGFRFGGRHHPVRTDYSGDLRLLFTSCNGQEEGDLDRDPEGRNALWKQAERLHGDEAFHLHLMGGDQIYADEVTGAHPVTEGWPEETPEEPADADALEEALFDAFFDRYCAVLGQAGTSGLLSHIPIVTMWDDHDICDGWGSLRPELTESTAGKRLFSAARRAFLIFQKGVKGSSGLPLAADPDAHFGFAAWLPGLSIVAPDLRTERRLGQVMGDPGWRAVSRMLEGAKEERLFFLSTVPLLGPRLSLVETAMNLVPGAQYYEDDLRDQWQSRHHRAEWRRMLKLLIDWQDRTGGRVTALSGEIHLAAHATMEMKGAPLRQLVSSGITHPPPPKAWARVLGLLSRLGDSPVPGHPIRVRAVPGRHRYVAERNFLTLSREDGDWTAVWHLERSGPTAPLGI